MLLLLGGLGAEVAAVALLVRLGRREPFVIPFDDLSQWAAPPTRSTRSRP